MERGTLTANGTTNTVTIADGSDTLETVAATINDADIGVTANVVKKTETNYALVCIPNREWTMR